jgi:hypothetical protein
MFDIVEWLVRLLQSYLQQEQTPQTILVVMVIVFLLRKIGWRLFKWYLYYLLAVGLWLVWQATQR